MQVRQLVGRRAGEVLEMPYDVARRCIEAGTATRLTEEVSPPRVRAEAQPKPKRRGGWPKGRPRKVRT